LRRKHSSQGASPRTRAECKTSPKSTPPGTPNGGGTAETAIEALLIEPHRRRRLVDRTVMTANRAVELPFLKPVVEIEWQSNPRIEATALQHLHQDEAHRQPGASAVEHFAWGRRNEMTAGG
jgi:hypothetical protein